LQDELQQLASSHGSNLPLAHRRCDNHAGREAAARCPQCRRFFCRECVTEHAGRVICADCLSTMASQSDSSHWSLGGLVPYLAALAGILVAWMAYYYIGQILLGMSHEFHEGQVW